LPTETLLNAKIHERRSENIGQIVHALSGNWTGCHMRMHSWADVWLVLGLQKYLANSYVGERINSNELRFGIKKQNAEYCKFVSQGLEIRPLFSQFFSSPNELLNDQVYMIKAPLILHMIESKVGKVHLQSVIHKLPNLNCATDQFVKSVSLT
jgi:aminopeptidase N